MLEKYEKEDLCQMSLTGIRSLSLLGLLIKAPRSLEEIKQSFIENNIMQESNSYDIIRIDLNTLKSMGCVISRADRRTNNKYVLLEHPFKIQITEDEVKTLKKAFNKIKENADVKILLGYNELFNKIADFAPNEDIKQQLLGISPLKKYSIDIVETLHNACRTGKAVVLIYKSPVSNKECEKTVVSEKVVLQNDKLYLYCVDKNSGESIYLNLKRILKIISQSDSSGNNEAKKVNIKFELKNFGISGLEENESIISGDLEHGFVIEGKYHNEFYATQRILSFGSNCTVIEPECFKEKIIEILKKMREIYNDNK